MSNRHLYFLCSGLAIIGLAVFAYKVMWLEFPIRPAVHAESWQVEMRVTLEGRGEPVKLKLRVPRGERDLQLVEQSFVSPGYGLTSALERGNPTAVFTIGAANGTQTFYYRTLVRRSLLQRQPLTEPAPEIPPPELDDAERAAADALARAARAQSADAESMAALVLARLQEAKPSGEATLLLGPAPRALQTLETAVDVLRLAGVPARTVHGLTLEPERRKAQFINWLEIHDRGRWLPVYPWEARPSLPPATLRWWHGRLPIAEASGGSRLRHEVVVTRAFEPALGTAVRQGRRLGEKLVEFSVFGLPVQTQAVFRALLVIPAGIFLLVVLRNVVGFKTFGTFMPVLIALAFRETGLVAGVVLFAIIVAIGLAIRRYMEQLKLLLVPRLATVVVVVIVILLALSLLAHKLGFERGLSIGLFPIVILTMTIERMTTIWEERGAMEALQQAAGSLVVGALCFALMSWALVAHLLFVFPELLLLVIAATMLLGRYTGYRLTEIVRFKALAR